jgi:ubiquitin-protein ligase E3 C
MACNDRPERHAILISLLRWLGKQKSFLDDLASILIFTKDSSSSSTIPATRKTYLSISPSRLKVRFTIIINVRRHSLICVPLEFGIAKILDLIPNGSNVAVTRENRLQCIQLVSHYRLSILQSEAFFEGLSEIIDKLRV